MMRKIANILATGLFLGGCCNSVQLSKPVSIDQVLLELNKDIQNSGVFSVSDLLNDNTKSVAEEKIYCAMHNADTLNPLVQMLDQSFNFELTGIFTLGGKFGVSAIGTVPTGSLEFDPTKTQQQVIKFPVTYVSLSSLPDVYLKQKMSYIGTIPDRDKYDPTNLVTKPKDSEKRHLSPKEEMISALLVETLRIKAEINSIQKNYPSHSSDWSKCPKSSSSIPAIPAFE